MSVLSQGNMVFDGIDAKDHGILISGEGAFNAPPRVYEMVEVPGRNGAVAIDQGRYENIEVTYPAAVWGEDQQAFREKLAAYRSEMASRIGYKRLEDTYHPDEYRLGIFREAVEVEPSGYNTAGEFDIVFDCKPQRFLKSGEDQIDLSGTSRHLVKGNPISFEWTSSAIQHGLLLAGRSKWVSPIGRITPYNPATIEPWSEADILLNGSSAGVIDIEGDIGPDVPSFSVSFPGGAYTVNDWMYSFDGTETITQDAYGYYHWLLPSTPNGIRRCTRFNFLTSYIPGYTTINDGDAWEDSGYFCWRFDGVSLSDMLAKLAEWDAAGNPMTIVAPRTSAKTGTVTVPSLTYVTNQINTLETDPDAEFTLDITAARTLDNPTPFEAYPLVEITGTGTVKIGETTLTISSNSNPPIYLDCELMEAYKIVGGVITSANSQITMDRAKFPSLPAGSSLIQASSGITGLKVTPRWWRL